MPGKWGQGAMLAGERSSSASSPGAGPITGGSSALGQITLNQADFTLVVEQ